MSEGNGVTSRLQAQIRRDFSEPGSALVVVRILSETTDSERIQAAIVFSARGDIGRLRESVAMAELDWRDVLVYGGLAHEDWRLVLDSALGEPGANAE